MQIQETDYSNGIIQAMTTLIKSEGNWPQVKAELDWHATALRQLRAKNWNPAPLTSAECLELLRLEREQAMCDALFELQTEARSYPTNPNPHCD